MALDVTPDDTKEEVKPAELKKPEPAADEVRAEGQDEPAQESERAKELGGFLESLAKFSALVGSLSAKDGKAQDVGHEDEQQKKQEVERAESEALTRGLRSGGDLQDIVENLDDLSQREAISRLNPSAADAKVTQGIERQKDEQVSRMRVRAQELQNEYDRIRTKCDPELPPIDIAGAAEGAAVSGNFGEVQARISEAQKKVEEEKAKEGQEFAATLIALTAGASLADAQAQQPQAQMPALGMAMRGMFGGQEPNGRDRDDERSPNRQQDQNSFLSPQSIAMFTALMTGNPAAGAAIAAAGQQMFQRGTQHTTDQNVAKLTAPDATTAHGLTAGPAAPARSGNLAVT